MEGLCNLLRLRGAQQLHTRRARGIFALTYGTAVSGALHASRSFGIVTNPPTLHQKIYALMAGNRSPLDDWEPLLDRIRKARNTMNSPMSRGSRFHHQVADLCSQMKSMSKFSSERTDMCEEAFHLKQAALDLDTSALDWYGDDPKWQPRFVSHGTTPPDTAQSGGRDVEYFPGFLTFRHWNFFRAARMVLQETLLHFDQLNGGSAASLASQVSLSVSERRRCANTIADMANDILNTLPFLYGDVDNIGKMISTRQRASRHWPGQTPSASLIIWLLRMIKVSEHTSSSQKDLATEALYKIGRTMGVRQALMVAAIK
jgi:hypothetical protein